MKVKIVTKQAQTKEKYWSTKRILKEEADYNIVIGKRSNGKTTGCLEFALFDEDYGYGYFKYGFQFAYIRRWKEDFVGKRGKALFDGIVERGLIAKKTNGEWTNMMFRSSQWTLTRYDAELCNSIINNEACGYAFALSSMEHDKSISYPKIKTVIFDEFLTNSGELPNEFMLFNQTLSTIIRDKDNVKIFMIGNTVNQYSTYFKEMGLVNVRKQQEGTIDIYEYNYGDGYLRVAVEYATYKESTKKSNKYFPFNNPKLKMITEGKWELSLYPHLPYKYKPKDVIYTFFIVYEENILQCEIIEHDEESFIFIHRKTTPLKENEEDLIYSQEFTSKINYRRKITQAKSGTIEARIVNYFNTDKVFYQDNEIGNIVTNYIRWCKDDNILNR